MRLKVTGPGKGGGGSFDGLLFNTKIVADTVFGAHFSPDMLCHALINKYTKSVSLAVLSSPGGYLSSLVQTHSVMHTLY